MFEKLKWGYRQEMENLLSPKLFDNIRKRLKFTKKDLPDKDIKKVLKLNNNLIGEWVVNNADGFKIKDNGILIVSKWMPKCLRGDKLEKIEEIMNNPNNDAYMKEMFTKRYNKMYYTFKDEKRRNLINLHSFFYIYKIMWFNSRNCKFDKADLYEFVPCDKLNAKLNEKIVSGKDYFSYNFSDFRERKTRDLADRKLALERKKALKLKGKLDKDE